MSAETLHAAPGGISADARPGVPNSLHMLDHCRSLDQLRLTLVDFFRKGDLVLLDKLPFVRFVELIAPQWSLPEKVFS